MTRYEEIMKMTKEELAEYLLGFCYKFDDDTAEFYWEAPSGKLFGEEAKAAAMEDTIAWLEEKPR